MRLRNLILAGVTAAGCGRDEPVATTPPFVNGSLAPARPETVILDGASPALSSGWAPREDGTTRWSKGRRSRVDVDVVTGGSAYALYLNVAPAEGKAPQTLSLKINDERPSTSTLPKGWSTVTAIVGKDALARGHATVELAYGWTDDQDRAVQLGALSLAPVPASLDVAIDEATVGSTLVKGWQRVDRGEGAAHGSWSRLETTGLRLVVDPDPSKPYRLTLTGTAALPVVDVEASVGAVSVGHASFTDAGGEGAFVIPAGKLQRGSNVLQLRFTPRREVKGSEETSELGLRLERLKLAPVEAR